MSDLSPDAYKVTTTHLPETTEDCPSCGTPWIWILLFIAALLAITGLAVWIILLYHKNSDAKGKQIDLIDPNVQVDSSSQITATWTSKTAGDKGVLYATFHPPQFTTAGGLSNGSAAANNSGAPITTVVGTTNKATVTGLIPGAKYYATLIVINSKSSNYQSYTQIVYMQGANLPPKGPTGGNFFEIQHILQVGAIQTASETSVVYNQKPGVTGTFFYLDAMNQIHSVLADGETIENVCLYNSNGTLAARACDGITGASLSDSQWAYNPTPFANRWCLSNTTTSATPTCMILPNISSGGTTTIQVGTTSQVGDAWANVFENSANN